MITIQCLSRIAEASDMNIRGTTLRKASISVPAPKPSLLPQSWNSSSCFSDKQRLFLVVLITKKMCATLSYFNLDVALSSSSSKYEPNTDPYNMKNVNVTVLQVFITDCNEPETHFSLPFAQHREKENRVDTLWLETVFTTHKHEHPAAQTPLLCGALLASTAQQHHGVSKPPRGINPNSFSLLCTKHTFFYH